MYSFFNLALIKMKATNWATKMIILDHGNNEDFDRVMMQENQGYCVEVI